MMRAGHVEVIWAFILAVACTWVALAVASSGMPAPFVCSKDDRLQIEGAGEGSTAATKSAPRTRF